MEEKGRQPKGARTNRCRNGWHDGCGGLVWRPHMDYARRSTPCTCPCHREGEGAPLGIPLVIHPALIRDNPELQEMVQSGQVVPSGEAPDGA